MFTLIKISKFICLSTNSKIMNERVRRSLLTV